MFKSLAKTDPCVKLNYSRSLKVEINLFFQSFFCSGMEERKLRIKYWRMVDKQWRRQDFFRRTPWPLEGYHAPPAGLWGAAAEF